MSINESLELSGGTPPNQKVVYTSSQDKIEKDYNRARVIPSQTGQSPSMWLIYEFQNWEHGRPEGEQPVILEGGEGEVVLQRRVRSAQGFNKMNPGIILFEHSQFRGFANLFQSNVTDLTAPKVFPQGDVTGVCSYIITGASGGEWKLFTGTNYSGTMMTVKSDTNGRCNLGRLSVDKQIKSIRFEK